MDTTLAYGLLLTLMNAIICICLPAVLFGNKQKRAQVNNTQAVEVSAIESQAEYSV